MPLSQVDGLLAGVIISPSLIVPSAWLQVILRTEDGEPVVFGGPKQYEVISGLLIDYYNTRVEDLHAGRYEALFEVDPGSGAAIWESWVEGFMLALGLGTPEAWETLIENPNDEMADAFAILTTLIAISQGEAPDGLQDEDELIKLAPETIADCVDALHRGRLEALASQRTADRQGPKAGRNDPCPCGSGKKYKKCCGLN